ncbi:hypothetical protein N7486_000957 [Penicillium sp. IBT 16267x]|nr:hypothetical protein N7486_000957 [Penicillium sp. IBT 16267x]
MVSIEGHKLCLFASGPTGLIIHQPPVIIESEWAAVQQPIAYKKIVYTYDRAGYGRSEASPLPQSAQD